MIRITNAPLLLLLNLYERKYLWQRARQLTPPRRLGWLKSMERLGKSHGSRVMLLPHNTLRNH